MKTVSLVSSLLLTLLVLGLSEVSIRASSYTWSLTPTGSDTWSSAANWGGSGYPNAIDDTATISKNLSANETVTLDGAITVGSLTLRNGTYNNFYYTIAAGSGGSLNFQVSSGSAYLISNNANVYSANVLNVISAPITLSSATIIETDSYLSITGAITGPGGITKTGIRNLTLSGTAYAGTITVNEGGLIMANNAVNASTTLTVNAGTTASFSFGNQHLGYLNINGGSFSGNFTYLDGALSMAGGTLAVPTGTLLGNFSSVTTTASATTATISATIANTTTKTFNVDRGTSATDLLVSGAISGGAVTKTGSGIMVLSGANGYTGATKVNAGTLLVDGSLAAGSTVSVVSNTTANAILGGTGTINGAVNVGGGTAGLSIVNAGDAGAIGTLNLANGMTFGLSSRLAFEIDSGAGTIDLVKVTGVLALGSGATLSGSDLGSGTFAVGTVLTLAQATGGITGTFAGVANGTDITVGNTLFEVDYLANSITLTALQAVAVPEPPAWALLGLGIFAAGLSRRARREGLAV